MSRSAREAVKSRAPLHELTPELQKKLAGFAGEWVAVTPSRLLAHGHDAKRVLLEARRKGVTSPILFRVPDDEASFYFF